MSNHNRFRWNNYVILEDDHGIRRVYKNTVVDNFRASIASQIAQQGTGLPTTIKLGKGTATEYPLSNRNTQQVLFLDSSQEYFSQGFSMNPAYPVNSVVLFLKRVGLSNGTVFVEIRTDNAGVPSNTVVTNGTSRSVDINYLETEGNGSWVRFQFDTPPQLSAATTYHIVLRSSGYTYAAGTSEVHWACDTTSPTYSGGVMNRYFGTGWAAVGADAIFKVIAQTDGLYTDLLSVLSSKTITARSKYNTVTARLLSVFTTTDAIDYIGEIGLFDDAGNLLAVTNADYDKSSISAGVNVYWLIEVLAEDG